MAAPIFFMFAMSVGLRLVLTSSARKTVEPSKQTKTRCRVRASERIVEAEAGRAWIRLDRKLFNRPLASKGSKLFRCRTIAGSTAAGPPREYASGRSVLQVTFLDGNTFESILYWRPVGQSLQFHRSAADVFFPL